MDWNAPYMGRDSTAFWHTFVEAKKLVYEDRARFVADPLFYKGSQASVDWLLSKDYARERAKLIDPARAAARIEAGHPGLGASDTTYLAVADADGNMRIQRRASWLKVAPADRSFLISSTASRPTS